MELGSSIWIYLAVIGHELRLVGIDQPPTQWHKDRSALTLVNTKLGTLHDAPTAWPRRLQMAGASIERWGGYTQGLSNSFEDRDLSWFDNWLGRDETGSMAKYEMVARLLEEAGEYQKAQSVRVLKTEKERQVKSGLPYVISSIDKWLTGYGASLERGFAVFGILAIIALPIFMTARLAEGSHTPRSWIAFTLDSIVPFAKLDADHDKVRFAGWQQYFLYLMRGMSAVLIFFVVAYLTSTIGPR